MSRIVSAIQLWCTWVLIAATGAAPLAGIIIARAPSGRAAEIPGVFVLLAWAMTGYYSQTVVVVLCALGLVAVNPRISNRAKAITLICGVIACAALVLYFRAEQW